METVREEQKRLKTISNPPRRRLERKIQVTEDEFENIKFVETVHNSLLFKDDDEFAHSGSYSRIIMFNTDLSLKARQEYISLASAIVSSLPNMDKLCLLTSLCTKEGMNIKLILDKVAQRFRRWLFLCKDYLNDTPAHKEWGYEIALNCCVGTGPPYIKSEFFELEVPSLGYFMEDFEVVLLRHTTERVTR